MMDARLPTPAEQRAKVVELRNKFYKPVARNLMTPRTQPVDEPLNEKIERLEAMVERLTLSIESLSERLTGAIFVQAKGSLQEKVEAIAEPIASRHGLTFEDVIGPRKFAHIVAARIEVWKAVYEGLPMYSSQELGRILRRNGSSIRHEAIARGWDKSKREQVGPRKAAARPSKEVAA